MGWESDSWPNGVVGTPDGKKLYVNKWYYDNKGGTWVFDINPDGTLSNMRKFTEWGGDGMSMDELGNVYISNGQGVMAFDPNGNNILRIPTGSGATNNTFAGRNEQNLVHYRSGGQSDRDQNERQRRTQLVTRSPGSRQREPGSLFEPAGHRSPVRHSCGRQ